MHEPPLVSVIIPNYNYARFLTTAISSVEQQTHTNLEIIVVNNGSTDDSLQVLSKFGSRIKVVNQENLGQAGARNSGLLAANGELIALLDADDFWQIDKLEKQVRLITPEVQLVYSGISRFDDESKKIESVLLPQYRGNCRKYFTDLSAVSIVLSGESTVLFTRNLLNQVGYFDAELNSASGWDFFRRCSILTEFDFVSEPLTNYRLHSSNMSRSNLSNIEDIRRAYKKLFADNLWKLSSIKKRLIVWRLEVSFIKTYTRDRNLILALKTLFTIFRIKSYSERA